MAPYKQGGNKRNCYFSGTDCPGRKCFAATALNPVLAGALSQNCNGEVVS